MGMPISTVAELDLDSMRLGPVDEMTVPRAYPSMVFLPDSLLLIGGTNCWSEVYGAVEHYDFLTQKWRRLKGLKHARYGHAAVTLQEQFVFVCGGCDRFYAVCNAEMYDRKTGKWTECGSMLKPSQMCNALKFREEIFVVGAKDDTVQVWNVQKGGWRLAGKLNDGRSARKGVKLCTMDYKLVAMHCDDVTKYEIYDDRSDRWYLTAVRNHPVHKLYPNEFMLGDQIFDWWHLGRRYW